MSVTIDAFWERQNLFLLIISLLKLPILSVFLLIVAKILEIMLDIELGEEKLCFYSRWIRELVYLIKL
jgi:hypothetical protein